MALLAVAFITTHSTRCPVVNTPSPCCSTDARLQAAPRATVTKCLNSLAWWGHVTCILIGKSLKHLSSNMLSKDIYEECQLSPSFLAQLVCSQLLLHAAITRRLQLIMASQLTGPLCARRCPTDSPSDKHCSLWQYFRCNLLC